MIATAIVVLLVLVNGLYVAAEFALLGASRQKIAKGAADGQKIYQRVHGIISDTAHQDQYIATAQLGITLASLGLGMYGEHTLAVVLLDYFQAWNLFGQIAAHSAATIIAVALLTYVHIVLGEMVPKSIALQNASRSLVMLYWPMQISRMILAPFVFLLNSVGSGLLRCFGIRDNTPHSHLPSLEELRFIVSESLEKGLLSAEVGSVLQELLEFSELTAYEAMVPRVSVTGIPLGADIEEMRRIVRKNLHSRYPVYEENLDHIIGQIHIKDILRLVMSGKSLEKSVVRNVPYAPDTISLEAVLALMRKERSQLVVVLDEHGGTAGIIAIEDLFEEVVGVVEEDPKKRTTQTDDGRIRVAGTFRLSELEEEFELDLEHEEVETVSGLILAKLERPPVVGDSISYRGLRLEVTRVRGRGVAECLVERELPGVEDSE